MDINDIADIDIIIARYLAGEATEEEAAALLEWIETSEANRRSFFAQRDIWHALNPPFAADEIDVSAAERRNMAAVFGARTQPVRSAAARVLRAWSRVAAVLVLPLLAALVYVLLRTDDREAAGQMLTISTAYGYTMETVLPDSSRVWLNANSSLTYPASFEGRRREVCLRGEAYFQVRSDREHPFSVHARDITVTATGTQFNVNSYPRSCSTGITLVDGRVEVTSPGDTVVMHPGEHLALSHGDATVTHNANIRKFCSWRDGILLFDDENLSDICARLEQIYNVEFDVDSAVASDNYHITLKGESIGEVMNLLRLSAPVDCEMEDDGRDRCPAARQRIRITRR